MESTTGQAEVTLDQLGGVEEGAAPGATAVSGAPAAPAQGRTADGISVTEERVPITRLNELNTQLKEAKEKLGELDALKSSSGLKWLDYLKANPKVSKAVTDAFNKAVAETGDPSLASMDDDDPNKALLMKIAALEKRLETSEDRTKRERDEREQAERKSSIANKIVEDYDTLVSQTKSTYVKNMLGSDFHMENILLRFAQPENKEKSLEQVAVEYLKNVPGIKVNTGYIASKKGPTVGARGGAPAITKRDNSRLTLDDTEELEAQVSEKLKALSGT